MNFSDKSLYQVVGVPPTATTEEITAGIKSQRQKVSSCTKFTAPQRELVNNKLKEAEEILTTPLKRYKYDQFKLSDKGYKSSLRTHCDYLISDKSISTSAAQSYRHLIFSNATRNGDVTKEISVTLEDLCNGKLINLKLTKSLVCNVCHGQTPNCVGCKRCGGKRTVPEEKTVAVNVEKGMRNSQKIRLSGEGNTREGNSADIVIVLKEQKHSVFRRLNDDLYMIKKIGLNEALCGFRGIIKTIDGRKVHFSQPPGTITKPGTMKLIKGKGMPVHKKTTRGDLYILFSIKFPSKILKTDTKMLLEFLPEYKCNLDKNNETEEYKLVDYDPKYKVNTDRRGRQAYDDERLVDKDVLNKSFSQKCTVQ